MPSALSAVNGTEPVRLSASSTALQPSDNLINMDELGLLSVLAAAVLAIAGLGVNLIVWLIVFPAWQEKVRG